MDKASKAKIGENTMPRKPKPHSTVLWLLRDSKQQTEDSNHWSASSYLSLRARSYNARIVLSSVLPFASSLKERKTEDIDLVIFLSILFLSL